MESGFPRQDTSEFRQTKQVKEKPPNFKKQYFSHIYCYLSLYIIKYKT